MSKFKPMLAATLDNGSLHKLTWPLIASPKVDGIRCFIHPRLGPVTRSLKPIPNEHIRKVLTYADFVGLDGELVIGDLRHPQVFNATTSGVMSHGGDPKFTYWVFDRMDPFQNDAQKPYRTRLGDTAEFVTTNADYGDSEVFPIKLLPHVWVHNTEELEAYEQECLGQGFEGIMLRKHDGPYKFGRSTMREHYLVKVKRWQDVDAIIEGYEPLLRNNNEATLSELGYTKRSSHQANKDADDTRVGKFRVRGCDERWDGVEFSVGSGLTDAQRLEYRQSIDSLIGRKVVAKYLPHGSIDAPRFPIWKGFRDD